MFGGQFQLNIYKKRREKRRSVLTFRAHDYREWVAETKRAIIINTQFAARFINLQKQNNETNISPVRTEQTS